MTLSIHMTGVEAWYSNTRFFFPHWGWKKACQECALGVGSQLSAHVACILIGICNAVAGGISMNGGLGLWSAILIGSAIYGLTVLLRFLWSRDHELPSLRTVTLGLALGIAVSAGFNSAHTLAHHRELTNWYRSLPGQERQLVRQTASRWIEKQSISQRFIIEDTARLMGYKSPEEFVLLNYCSISAGGHRTGWREATATLP